MTSTYLRHVAIFFCLATLQSACGRALRSHSNQVAQVIPNVIFFTGPWKPQAVVDGSRKVVPQHTEFRYYDNAQMAQSVHEISQELMEQGVSGAEKAFQELRPVAFQADLWRYMILWQQGGIYLDAKIMLTAPLASWVNQQSDEMAACWDNPEAYGQAGAFYWNAMLAARKHNPSLLSAIKRIISHTEKHYYGEDEPEPEKPFFDHRDLSITGPIMLTRVLNTTDTTVATTVPRVNCTFLGAGRGQIVGRDGTVIAKLNQRVYGAMHRCERCNVYEELFGKRQIYCNEPGPPCSTFSLSQTLKGKPKQAYRSFII